MGATSTTQILHSTSPGSYILPDLLRLSNPFKASMNPYWARAASESSAWFSSYSIFSDQELTEFAVCKVELLVAYAYPHANYETFRTCCDFMNLIFAIDEISDMQNGEDARETGNVFLNALRDAGWTDGSALAEMTKDFRARFLRSAGPQSFRRFLKVSEDYIDCVTKEAGYRERSQILDMESFKYLRRDNSGVPLMLGLLEYTLGIDLPDVVFENAALSRIYWAAVDMVWWANDVYSYKVEQAKGLAGNNVLSVLMASKNIDLQDASDYVGDVYAGLMKEYMEAKAELVSKSFGSKELDAAVNKYVDKMENWPIGNLEWSFASMRYFGSQSDEIKRTMTVILKPQDGLA